MIKRPLCLIAVLFLGIQTILTAGFQIAKDLEPSALEMSVKEGENLVLLGKVSRREEKPDYQVYYLTDNQIRLKNQIIKESKILVYIKLEKSQKEQIAVGNTIQAEGEVSFFSEATNPGNFNQKFYYQKQGIHALVWADEIKRTDSAEWLVREKLTVLRENWKGKLVRALGEKYGNCMSAILLGDKSELDTDVKDLYQKCGIGHILAISGLHMTFLGIGLYQLLRRLGLGFVSAGGIGITILLLYTLMIGGGVSSTRALIMFIVRIGADLFGRDYDMLTSLSVAAIFLVWQQPLYLMDAGFLLSFGAILGIAVLFPVLKSFSVIPKTLGAGLSIHLILLPVMLYYYYEFPTYSLLLNLLVVPLMSVVLGAGIMGSLLLSVWNSAGYTVLQICKGILWMYESLGNVSVRLPFGRMVTGQPQKIWIVLYYLLLSMFCLLMFGCKKRCRKSEKAFHIPIFVSILLIGLPIVFCLGCKMGQEKRNEMEVVVLDVGQGDCLYVRTPFGSHYLIDGGSSDVSNVGKYRIEPFLKSKGVGKLDYVFISHGDEDHLSGVRELLENQLLGVKIDTLVLPPESLLDESLTELAKTALENGTRVVTIQCGEQITDAEMVLTCLAPLEDYAGEIGNASSMVLSLQYREFDMLFTGDVEGDGEKALSDSGLLKHYDVLKVAHHGSKNSTSDEFLAQVSPAVALISAGRENRYGHPHAETIEKLESCGSRIYNTQSGGAILLSTDGKKMEMKNFTTVIYKSRAKGNIQQFGTNAIFFKKKVPKLREAYMKLG